MISYLTGFYKKRILSVVDNYDPNILINFSNNKSLLCECEGHPEKPTLLGYYTNIGDSSQNVVKSICVKEYGSDGENFIELIIENLKEETILSAIWKHNKTKKSFMIKTVKS